MIKFKSGERVMNGTNERDAGTVLEVKPGCDANDHVIVRWDNGETAGCGADCLNSLDRGAYQIKPKLKIISESRDSAILVCDEHHNDIAEFYHSDHATVGQSYETALMLARKLVEATNGPPPSAKMSEQINIIVRDYGLERLSASEAHDALMGVALSRPSQNSEAK